VLFEDRSRACSFGADAEGYDSARPSYPQALIDFLLAEAPRLVLDVGCGTGKAGRLLAARGCAVLGVEPDHEMAAVATGHGITVEHGTFEEWGPRDRRFELVISGQAWHWVNPFAGTAKLAEILMPGGRFAAFWNVEQLPPEALASVADAYARFAPSLASSSARRERFDDGSPALQALMSSDALCDAATHVFCWQQTYTTAEWISLLRTHSDHRLLPDETRAPLLEAIRQALDERGGTMLVSYETEVVTARARRA
jgi:trans-aconitate methyltransferase